MQPAAGHALFVSAMHRICKHSQALILGACSGFSRGAGAGGGGGGRRAVGAGRQGGGEEGAAGRRRTFSPAAPVSPCNCFGNLD